MMVKWFECKCRNCDKITVVNFKVHIFNMTNTGQV